jgi:MOSC domain-containing protein YiiM
VKRSGRVFEGEVVSIQVSSEASRTMRSRRRVEAVAGRGLKGDRYYLGTGTYSDRPDASRQVTLIESEAIEALASGYALRLPARDTRRNITTRGVPLNHLVGHEFRVGGARFRGIRLCEPCSHLEQLTGKALRAGLVHRGGLRAEILEGGMIAVGDPVVPA